MCCLFVMCLFGVVVDGFHVLPVVYLLCVCLLLLMAFRCCMLFVFLVYRCWCCLFVMCLFVVGDFQVLHVVYL